MRFDAPMNKDMTDTIMTSVKGIYPGSQDIVIKEGIKRYFVSTRDKNRRVSTGKHDKHKKKMVLYGRKKRKLENRKAAVSVKTSWDEEKKEKINTMLCMDMMSSESEVDSDGEPLLTVKRLPWRNEECNKILKDLDKKAYDNKSKKSKKMEMRRVRGAVVSERPLPEELRERCPWAIDM